MALSSTTVWEVRTTGNAANGAAYDASKAGVSGSVDYSQQDAAQVAYSDLAVDATVNTKITSAASPFAAAHVGNVIKISSSSPWTPGYYTVMQTDLKAAHFKASSSQYLSIADNSTLKIGGTSFTWAGWAYMDSKAGFNVFVSKRQFTTSQDYICYYENSGGTFTFTVSNGSAAQSITTAGFGTIAVKTWYYISFWFDSTANTINIQVNNGTVYSATATVVPATAPVGLAIGSQFSSSASITFDGRVDSLSFWKRTLTSGERTTLYNSGTGRVYSDLAAISFDKTSLVSWWDFDEVSGTRFDSVGTNHLTDNNSVGTAAGIAGGSAAYLDRSPAAAGSTGGAGKLGGASDHPATIAASVVASNVVWVKSGSYVLGADLSFSATVTPSSASPYTRIEGYGTVRGDGVRATLRAGGTATAVLALSSLNGYSVANLAVDGATTSANGIVLGQTSRVYNCKGTGITGTAIQAGTGSVVETCEVTACGGTYGINAPRVVDCNVHDNTCTGIYSPGSGFVEDCVVTNNTGATSDGILIGLSTSDSPVRRCTVHGNGRHGINWQATTAPLASGNILSSNGGYGFLCNASAGFRASPFHDGNAYYANTSGTRSNGGDTTVNPQNASGAYANPLDKVLTVSPFTNAAGGDFSLNATAGGGASCRGAGFPISWPGSSVVSYADMGAAQHQGAGGGSVIGSPIIRPLRRHG